MKTGILVSLLVTWSLNNASPIFCKKMILGSDDEVLTPLFEKNDVSIAVSTSHNHNSLSSSNSKRTHSSKSRKKSRNAIDNHNIKSHLKMNLDLPSIKTNLAKESMPTTVENVLERLDFNIPFDGVNQEDIEFTSLKQLPTKNGIAPGTIIADTKKATVQPGIVIVSKAQPGVVIVGKGPTVPPGTIVGIADTAKNPNVISAFAELPFSDSSDDFVSSSLDLKINEYKPPSNTIMAPIRPDLIGRQKKIHALEEYTIHSLKHENDYFGPKIDLENNITVEYVNSVLIPFFKTGKTLDRKSAYSVTIISFNLF